MQFTARAGLKKPDGPENALVGDLNDNADILSAYAVGDFLCTSVTRPGAPWQGMSIYQTDDNVRAFYDGAAWKPAGLVICTFATRPAAPLTGQQIFETDTKARLLWDGAAWVSNAITRCTAATRPANPVTGQVIYETDTKVHQTWDGAAWRQNAPYAEYVGSAVSVAGGGFTINFPAGRFSVAPIVVVSVHWAGTFAAAAVIATAAQCNGYVNQWTGAAWIPGVGFTVYAHATQMTALAAIA